MRTLDDTGIARQVKLADAIIGRLTGKSGHYCFYRSLTLAYLMRKQGIPLVINVGGRSLGSSDRMKAHSWLTWNDAPFFEQPNAVNIYPFVMGFNADRTVRYWVGPDLDDGIFADRSVARGNASRPAAPGIGNRPINH